DDPTTPGGVAPKQVMNTFVRQTEALVDLYVDGELISTTGEHPLWVADKGWVEAKDLQVGDLLQTDEETFVDVDRIEKREGDFEVYNFDVEGFSTYFVSDLGVLVHNANCDPARDAGSAEDIGFLDKITPKYTLKAENPGQIHHIMQPEHGWNQLISLTGDQASDFDNVSSILKSENLAHPSNLVEIRAFPPNNSKVLRLDFEKTINGKPVYAAFEYFKKTGEMYLKDAWVIDPS
ncbi:MAG: polymorphic toxin-type HINT domain-containing protein, partial [Spirulinaceae cyanobacterium]